MSQSFDDEIDSKVLKELHEIRIIITELHNKLERQELLIAMEINKHQVSCQASCKQEFVTKSEFETMLNKALDEKRNRFSSNIDIIKTIITIATAVISFKLLQ